jgi:DNA-binding SARP family transcriptional activator
VPERFERRDDTEGPLPRTQPAPSSSAPPGSAAKSDVRPVHLGLMNGFELRVGGALVALPQSVQRLLAFLAMQERAVTRAFVAGTLWLEKSEERAGANLRSVIWRSRAPHCRLLEASATHLRLAGEVEVDLHVVRALAHSLIAGTGEAPPWPDVQLLDGQLLPDWYDDWLVVERERLRQLQLHALEAHCRRLTDLGRFAEAIELGLVAVASEPLRESAHRAVIDAHLAEGNNGEALRQYEVIERLLADHLGITPTIETELRIASIRSERTSQQGV